MTSKTDSLLRLFQSEYFTVDMLLQYLHKKFDEKGICGYLINKLYSIKEFDRIIPEICFLTVRRDSPALEKLLVDKSTQDIEVFIRIYWTLTAFGFSDKGDKKMQEKVTRIVESMLVSVVNGSQVKVLDDNEEEKGQEMLEFYGWKHIRSKYISLVLKFVTSLVKVSQVLKTIPKTDDRKTTLLEFLLKFNRFLRENRRKSKESHFEAEKLWFEGIILPFQQFEENTKFNSKQVVRIIEDEALCFSTNKRCPYKILLETIDMEDLKKYTPNTALDVQNSGEQIEEFKTMPTDLDIPASELSAPIPADDKSVRMEKLEKFREFELFSKIMEEQASKAGGLQRLQNKLLTKDDLNAYVKSHPNLGIRLDLTSPTGKEPQPRRMSKMALQEANTPKTQHELFDEVFPIVKRERRASDDFIEKTQMAADKEEIHLIDQERFNDFISRIEEMNAAEADKKEDGEEGSPVAEISGNHSLNKLLSLTRRLSSGAQSKMSYVDACKSVTKLHPWGQVWHEKAAIIRMYSPYGHFPSYKLRPLIIKGDDDLRQEAIAMQIISKIHSALKAGNLNLFIRPYEICAISQNSGILEFIPNTISIDSLKRCQPPGTTLFQFYKETFGDKFDEAQKNFAESLAGYSIVTYLLQIKDRHNANILIDSKGHLIHVDFSYMLSVSPGGINFESAPFKLTNEYVELLGGQTSNMFRYFRVLLVQGFLELRKHLEDISIMLQVMMEESELPCFENFNLEDFRQRFKFTATDKEWNEQVDWLISESLNNWRTVQYDNFQKLTNGILP